MYVCILYIKLVSLYQNALIQLFEHLVSNSSSSFLLWMIMLEANKLIWLKGLNYALYCHVKAFLMD